MRGTGHFSGGQDQPANSYNGKAMEPFQVVALGSSGTVDGSTVGEVIDTDFAETVTLTLAPAAGTLDGTLAVAAEAGVATCDNVLYTATVHTKRRSQRSNGMAPQVAELGNVLPCRVRLFDVEGGPAFAFLPQRSEHEPTPWVWYAPTFIEAHSAQDNAWLLERWLHAGFAIAGVEIGESFGSPAGRALFTAFHARATAELGLAPRPVLHPQSRGGLMLYNWAAEHPDKVACVVGVYTVCDLRSYPGLATAAPAYGMTAEELETRLADHNPIDRLAPLARHHIPILHIHGDADVLVPLEANSGELVRRYRALGGNADVIVVPGKGHEVIPEYFERTELAEFAICWGVCGDSPVVRPH